MTLQKAIELLERYNRWRKGADVQMPLPNEISEAIDTVINHYKYSTTK